MKKGQESIEEIQKHENENKESSNFKGKN